MSIVVIDYGMGNLGSVRRSLEDQGADVVVSGDPAVVETADALVLPGVGAFAEGMARLDTSGLSHAIRHAVDQGCPLLGICLGMQLLADKGDEGGATAGLGLVPGAVSLMMPNDSHARVPHVGWNEVVYQKSSELFDGIVDRTDFYFVHSYAFQTQCHEHVVATTPHGGDVVSVVQRQQIMGTQFHPEKSSRGGCQLLANFLRVTEVSC